MTEKEYREGMAMLYLAYSKKIALLKKKYAMGTMKAKRGNIIQVSGDKGYYLVASYVIIEKDNDENGYHAPEIEYICRSCDETGKPVRSAERFRFRNNSIRKVNGEKVK